MLPINLFISYSHKDEDLRQELENHLKILHRQGLISVWTDRKILPGSDLSNEIDINLKSSQVILLLISSDFISSDYCYDIEMKEALKLHSINQAKVIPIILRDCRWENLPFGKLLALPNDGKPITGKDWHSKDEAFKNVERGIEDAIKEMRLVTKSIGSEAAVGSTDEKTLQQAIELFEQKKAQLNHFSSKGDLEDLQKIKNDLYNRLFEELDGKIENTPLLLEKLPIILFDSIFVKEKLDSLTVQEIHKLRSNKDSYKWYHRKVIINSLTLSLLRTKKFDQQKVNLLIDFITDFEEQVWESALVGLVLTLVHHQNKWLKFNEIKLRLQTLKVIEKVQDGLGMIETILRYKIYSESFFDKNMFNKSFFQTPVNCFLPFYDDNKILSEALASNDTEIDSEYFTNFLNELPFLDSHKYNLCLSLQEGTVVKRKLKDKELLVFASSLSNSKVLFPYQNLICEYYNFINYYPQKNIDNIFNSQLSIAKTKLKDLILDNINEMQISANMYIDEKEYRSAINKLTDLLKIDPDNIQANFTIADCYVSLKQPDFYSALSCLLKLKSLGNNNVELMAKIFDCYMELKKHSKALEYLELMKDINANSRTTLISEVQYYSDLDKYDELLLVATKGKETFPSDAVFSHGLFEAYVGLGNFTSALSEGLFALSNRGNKSKSVLLRALAETYFALDDIDNALKFALLAYDENAKDPENNMTLGRIYLLGYRNSILARKHLEKSNTLNADPIVFGNLGHLELFEGNVEKAFENYEKCITGLNDSKSFAEKMEKDKLYLFQLDITEQLFVDIKNKVIVDFDSKTKNMLN